MVTQVAVLDDYHGVASSHFAKLDPSQYVIKYLPATLRPYNHPDTPQAERDELAERLEPFEVIGKMAGLPPPQINADTALPSNHERENALLQGVD